MGTPHSPPPSPPATSSSATMSPIMSSIYPDRPIRPLPRRSIKDRLSVEAAEAIDYPPPPSAIQPKRISKNEVQAFQNGNSVRGTLKSLNTVTQQVQEHADGTSDGAYRFRGNEILSEDEDDGARYQNSQRNGYVNGHDPDNNHSVASSNDSADGYDSFENTNNKKKRKIPASGSLAASLSQDMAKLGISNDVKDLRNRADNGMNHYYSTGSVNGTAGTGLSGAGRGRFGRDVRRTASGRLPLHASANGANGWHNNKTPTTRKESDEKVVNGDRGIISQAIADAATSPVINDAGHSLLDQPAQRKPANVNTQFTFTYESDSSNKPVWPADHPSSISHPQHNRPPIAQQHGQVPRKDFSTHGTQTSPPTVSQPSQPAQPVPPRDPRRSAAKRYAIAARERRAQQAYSNFHHPPKEEDFWMCEFCEYESIFGEPPLGLIRQYERKDEKERKRQAEKRRLLEKAKMKGRKGKKGKKGANNANPPPPPAPAQQQRPPYDPAMPANYPPYNQSGEDEYYEDYDEAGPTPVPSPEPLSRIPQPINSTPGQSTRIAHSTVNNTANKQARPV